MMANTGWIINSALGINDAAKGTFAWGSLNRLTASDDAYCNATPAAGQETNWLRTRHDLSDLLPINQLITGIEVRIEAHSIALTEQIIEVQIYNTWSLLPHFTGTAKTPSTALTTSDVLYDFGGVNDLWGFSPRLITLLGITIQFGFRCGSSDGTGQNVRIDTTWLKVHYAKIRSRSRLLRRRPGGFFPRVWPGVHATAI